MMNEKLIRLPARLRGIVRTDPGAPGDVAAPHQEKPDPELAKERQALEHVVKSLREAAGAFRVHQQHLLKDMQKIAVDLAMAVAGRFLHQRVAANEFPMETLVRRAIERLEPRQAVTVALHPEDLALLEKRLAAEPNLPLHTQEVQFLADATVRRGGCKVQAGEIMAITDLDEQLAELHAQLQEAVETAREVPALRPFPEHRQTA